VPEQFREVVKRGPVAWDNYSKLGCAELTADEELPSGSYDLSPDSTEDFHGHGTHVASLAAGLRLGIASHAKLLPIKAAWPCRVGKGVETVTHSLVLTAALKYVRDLYKEGSLGKKVVVNVSLGILDSEIEHPFIPTLMKQLNLCHDDGILVVAASGNNGRPCDVLPACHPKTLTVNASAYNSDEHMDFKHERSNYGPSTHIFAPGHRVLGADWKVTNGAITRTGTPFASPITAGYAAFLLSMDDYTPVALMQRILDDAAQGQIDGVPDCTPNRLLYTRGTLT